MNNFYTVIYGGEQMIDYEAVCMMWLHEGHTAFKIFHLVHSYFSFEQDSKVLLISV